MHCKILNATVGKQLEFGKGKWKWQVDLEGTFQSLSDNNVVRLPQLYTFNRLQAEFPMFKGVVRGNLGAEVTWYSGFKANAYMPATGAFYLQDSLSIGNYPFIDVFFNARIRNVRAFVKLTHVHSGLFGYEYWGGTTLHFPRPCIPLRIGMEVLQLISDYQF